MSVLVAHGGASVWELLAVSPFLGLGLALLLADWLHRRHPERLEAHLEAMEREADERLDEILRS